LDKFYLVDHSTNGTTLIGPDQVPLTLHREEAPLIGCGEILCGFVPEGGETCATVRYLTLGLLEALDP
jgi:hypothetical protein